MIATGAEIREALAGVIRLWKGDVSGFLAFDRSLGGFWRSYTAALLGVPVHALLLLLSSGEAAGPIESWHDALVEVLAYAVTWLAFPLLMLGITDRMGRAERFFDYMVPYNWSALAQLLLFTVAALLRAALPGSLGAVLMLVALAAVLHLQWFIAREGLAISGRFAFLVVVADLSLSFLIGGIADYSKA